MFTRLPSIQMCGAGESPDAVTDWPGYPLDGLDALYGLGDLPAPAEAILGGTRAFIVALAPWPSWRTRSL